MPVSKKRRKPEKKRHRRDAPETPAAGQHSAPAEGAGASGGGGFLGRMRGGFQSMTGSGPKKPESLLSKIVTWALVAAVAYFVAKRFGLIR